MVEQARVPESENVIAGTPVAAPGWKSLRPSQPPLFTGSLAGLSITKLA